MNAYTYAGETLGVDSAIRLSGGPLHLHRDTLDRVRANREAMEDLIGVPGKRYYGVNTGFGSMYTVDVSPENLRDLQLNLLRSHACGVGGGTPPQVVRLTLLLKILSLAKGYSGIRPEVLEALMHLHNHDILPAIPSMGSLGASGDLAPLAHLSLAIVGEGEVVYKREQMPAARALALTGGEPLTLEAKEGLALINGTQFSLAWLVYALHEARRLAEAADLCAAMAYDAFDAGLAALDPGVHRIRNQAGQIASAARISQWLADSPIARKPKQHLQDPYSFRCAPQVHGATRDTIDYLRGIADREINAVTDNPLVFSDEGETRIVSGGNFHAQPLALASDFLSIALAELGSISERRSYLLVAGQRGLPPNLAKSPGLESGMMICQYTAASIVNRNKILSHPASTDSIVTSAGQEDHVSMAAGAGLKLYEVVNNVWKLLGIEWMIAAQALDCRRPARSSDALEAFHTQYRLLVPPLDGDRSHASDIDRSVHYLRQLNLS